MQEERQAAYVQQDNLEYLFETALSLRNDERASWLSAQCKDDPEKIQEVVALLNSHEADNGFLSRTAGQNLHIQIPDFTGKTVGAYKIEHLLGKGGMGRVYSAYRNDGEFEKKVAIKFIKSLNVDNELIKRERQILADLEISNVVTLLDGGTTKDGYTYIVMEYVEGLPIDAYVCKHQLNQEQIIHMLIKLCEIVHKANNRGIIHCDLKPGNIMVRDDEVLKLFDFGISRVAYHADHSGVEDNLCKAMTPEYSSPQRCQNHIPAITDDVYSLGIIMATLLLEQQPVVITNETAGSSVSQKLFSDQLQNPELKAIFLKATAPDAEARYPSARAFAHDLQQYLENKCISVFQNKMGYRLNKTVQNDWPKLLASALMLILLLTIPAMLYTQYKMQKNENDVNEVITNMIENINEEFEKYQTSPYLRKTLIKYAVSQTDGYRNVKINSNKAKLYTLMGEVSGHPYAISEDNTLESKLYYEKGVELYEKLLHKREDQVKAYEEYTNAKRHLAVVIGYSGDMKKGFSMLKKVRETMHDAYENNGVPAVKRYNSGLYAMVEAFGRLHIKQYDEATELLDYAEPFFKNADNKSSEDYLNHMAFFYELRGHIAHLQNNTLDAKEYYRKVIGDYAHLSNPTWKIQRSLGRINQGLGCLLLKENKPIEANQRFLKAKAIYEKLSKRYYGVTLLETRLKDFSGIVNTEIPPSVTTLLASMNCVDPRKFMLPPRRS